MENLTNSFTLKWVVNYKARDKAGNIKFDVTEENLVVNSGKGEIINLIGNVTTPAAFTYLANGSDATVAGATQTALLAENDDTYGAGRAAATVARATTVFVNDTLSLTKTWSITGNVTVNEVGIFNDDTAGIMLGRQVTSVTKNLTDGDSFQVVYKIIIA